jgi:hypothetical protein
MTEDVEGKKSSVMVHVRLLPWVMEELRSYRAELEGRDVGWPRRITLSDVLRRILEGSLKERKRRQESARGRKAKGNRP